MPDFIVFFVQRQRGMPIYSESPLWLFIFDWVVVVMFMLNSFGISILCNLLSVREKEKRPLGDLITFFRFFSEGGDSEKS